MVRDDIDDELDAQGVGLIYKALSLLQGAIVRLDIHVIGDVIAVIHLRGWIPRSDPDGINAESF